MTTRIKWHKQKEFGNNTLQPETDRWFILTMMPFVLHWAALSVHDGGCKSSFHSSGEEEDDDDETPDRSGFLWLWWLMMNQVGEEVVSPILCHPLSQRVKQDTRRVAQQKQITVIMNSVARKGIDNQVQEPERLLLRSFIVFPSSFFFFFSCHHHPLLKFLFIQQENEQEKSSRNSIWEFCTL